MEVIVGKYAGFCPGVKRAWQLVSQKTEKPSQIFILGELIHNKQALDRLTEWGVKTIEQLDDFEGKQGTVVIRAHGEPPQTYQKLKKLKLGIIDATCPSVTRVQKLAQKTEEEGYQVFVCGEEDHPEAKATVGYTKKGKILPSVEAAREIKRTSKIGVLSQTTFSPLVFAQIGKILQKKCRVFKSLGTICNFVQLAQKEARKVAKQVDLVVVVGGRQSSNTKRLTEVVGAITKTYHIETAAEIQKKWFERVGKIGLLAGASTPEWIIKDVREKMKKF